MRAESFLLEPPGSRLWFSPAGTMLPISAFAPGQPYGVVLADCTVGRRTPMPMMARLRQFLDERQVRYEVHSHPERFNATAVAEVEHIPPREMAKVVILRAGKEYLMV